MGQNTNIEWCHHTFNAWRGCTKVSDGCKHCYADTLSKRNPKSLGIWGPKGTRVVAAESYWRQPLAWNTAAFQAGERHRVFCASLADVFEGPDTMPAAAWPEIVLARARLINLIFRTPHLDWLLLTKRPENVVGLWDEAATEWGEPGTLAIGMPNVWIGTSVENQATADERIPHLLRVPAAVRFLSIEPLLGAVDLERFGPALRDDRAAIYAPDDAIPPYPIVDWVIVGGESGPHARPMHPQWARDIRDQCVAAGVPFFFKQWGEHVPWDHRHLSNESAAALMQAGKVTLRRRMMPDGTSPAGECTREEMDRYMRDGVHMLPVGKSAAGRLLDGREWNEMPAVAGVAR